MKSYRNIRLAFIFFIPLFFLRAQAQESNDKIDGILVQLPAKDKVDEQRLFTDLMGLGSDGLTALASQVLPNGKAEGTKVRYAVALLTHTATTAEQKRTLEKVYLSALSKANDAEVKTYFITNLKLVGTSASVLALKGLLGNKDVFDPAVTTLVTIGGDEAKEALLSSLDQQSVETQIKLIKALGRLQYKPAISAITKHAGRGDAKLKKQALWSLAMIGDPSSSAFLLQQAKSSGFTNDPTESTTALVEFMHQQNINANVVVEKEIATTMLANTSGEDQKHYRLAALKALANLEPESTIKLILKEEGKFDSKYQNEVLKIGSMTSKSRAGQSAWIKAYKKSSGNRQGEILTMMANANTSEEFAKSNLLPALSSSNVGTRTAAASAIAHIRNNKYITPLLDYLLRSNDRADLNAAEAAILQLLDKSNSNLIASRMPSSNANQKVVLLNLLASRRTVDQFKTVHDQTSSADTAVKAAAFRALPYVSSSEDVPALLTLLSTAEDRQAKAVQAALISAVDKSSANSINQAFENQKTKLLPVLPFIGDGDALNKVLTVFKQGDEKQKSIAFEALTHWTDGQSIRPLLAIRKDAALKQYHPAATEAFLSQLSKSNWPDDQKLLLIREIMPLTSDKKEKIAVLRAAANVRTFLSLIFVSGYLNDPELSSAASRSAMQIALPTADARPGLTGIEIRNTLQRMADKLTGADSQYERIDIMTYMAQLPFTKGFESIFNGKDLSGWQGLVEDPIKRSKMSPEALAKKQKEANEKIKANWSVRDGMIVFQGDGANLCTIRKYRDFEMIVDWKISKNGDSGIYLRGSPQVQIWDISRVADGAQVGSGGLYNNQKERSTPLTVADNPIGEWNTFNIRMVDDRVTVYLNGILVVDNVIMENYWDRAFKIFPEEAIELQAHGTDLAFRNIYVKELNTKPYELSKAEKDEGFEVLFDGQDLDKWVGNKTDYVIEDNTIAIYPAEKSHGNLYTAKEFGNFNFRFEFQLTPGANNGLGIHSPLEGDAAYGGKEIQILDNTSSEYDKLQAWQYHGSVYGVMPAKREFLKPVGEWNQQEVYVKGDYIKVTLNGTVIVEGDLKKASKNGTLDHKEHPGLNRHNGHIGFLGHGTVVKFRNIRIKELSN